MSRFPSGARASSSRCERYADEIATLDETGPETPERRAARNHLAQCSSCQREFQDVQTLSAELRDRVESFMARAPSFTAEEIAGRAAGQTSAARSWRRDDVRLERKGDPRPSRETPPMTGGPSTAMRGVAPASVWRRALSTAGSVAAVALITALLAMTLTGHLLGRPSSAGHQVGAHATAAPLSALKIYAPGKSSSFNEAPSLAAYRASDGALVNATPAMPVAAWGAVTVKDVRYQLTISSANLPNANATAPATLSATKTPGGQIVWSERVGPIFTPDLDLDNGVLYLSTRVMGIAGVDPRIMAVYAYRASDGARLWAHALDAQPDGPPIVLDGVMYLVAGQTALALRASDGATLWESALPTGKQQIISAWLTVASGALYIYTSLTFSTGQKDGFGVDVFALRLTDGGTAWKVTVGTDIFPADGPFAPVVADGVVYVRLAPTKFTSPVITLNLVALRAADGATLWRYTSTLAETGDTGVPNIYPPAVSNGVVFVTEDGGALTALSAHDGRRIWSVNVDHTSPNNETYPYSITSPLAVDGAVFVIVSGELVAVRASDGQTLWRAPCGSISAPLNYQPFQLVAGL